MNIGWVGKELTAVCRRAPMCSVIAVTAFAGAAVDIGKTSEIQCKAMNHGPLWNHRTKKKV